MLSVKAQYISQFVKKSLNFYKKLLVAIKKQGFNIFAQ